MRFDPRRVVLWFAMVFSLSLFSAATYAQTNTVGSIFGSGSGDRVVVTDTKTGAVRTASVDSDGNFQITALPPGTYKVELLKGGNTVGTREVSVSVGAGSEVTFAAAGSTQLDTLEVTGKAGQYDIDVSSTDTRTTFTADRLEKMTIARGIEEVALLAPGAVRGDSRYNTNRGTSTASFGGSGANENAFYLNGYSITDVTQGLGSSSLPFNGIGQMQLLTGGYSAEFGRSTGGVVNIVTKRGDNYLKGGAIMQLSPSDLRAAERDVYYPQNGAATDNVLWRQTSKRETDSRVLGAYVSGPIFPNKAFFYLSGELENRTVEGPRQTNNVSGTSATGGPTGWHDREIRTPRVLGKLDWNMFEGHSLEFTMVSDKRFEDRKEYQYYYTGAPAGLGVQNKGAQLGGRSFEEGGQLYIGRYTGAILDNLIFTALVGQQRNRHEDISTFGYDPSYAAVRDNGGLTRPAGTLVNANPTTTRDPKAYDGTKGFRLDLEWLLSSHSLRGGYDVQNLTYRDATVSSGPGYIWLYDHTSAADGSIPGGGGAACSTAAPCDYVAKVVTATGGTFTTDQYAFYVEDRWQVTENVLLSLGLRNENFKNYNSDKVIFLEQTNQWAPRLGVTWDTMGDSSLRVFGNLGRYHLAIPLNVAFRQVGGSTNTSEYFSYTGQDANNQPTGLVALGSGPFSPNQEYGQARDPSLSAANGLKPYYQDELAFGAETKLTDKVVGGARFIFRKLGSQIDDNCDFRPAYNWAVQNGYVSNTDAGDILHGADAYGDATGTPNQLDDRAEYIGAQLAQCRIINPGEANKMNFTDIDSDGDGQPDATERKFVANISAEQFGLPKLDRTYKGLDLFIEHPFRDGWYAKLDWTLSRNKGNAEGQLDSSTGQQDVSVTANWDHPEIMVNAAGYLPNDRTHQIKSWAFYQFSPEWKASVTINSLSGRPKTQSGFYQGGAQIAIAPSAVNAAPDSDAAFVDYVDYGGAAYQQGPRGSTGRLPWTTTFDVGGSYSPNFMKNDLSLSLDVFNVFNTQKVQNQVEFYEASAPGVRYHSYTRPLSYNAPRSVRLTARYDWGM